MIMPINRILFDTNIWNYLADYSSVAALKRAAMGSATKILVAPSTLYEALRINSAETRARRAALITDSAWTRLMPEAYSESQEFLKEIGRLRPQWLKAKGNRGPVQRLRHDWGRTKRGFWTRVRKNPDQEAQYIKELGDVDLEAARKHAYAQRKLFMESNWDFSTPLTDVVGTLVNRPPGYDGDKIEAWRVNAWSSTTNALGNANHPYIEWLSADVNFDVLIRDQASWLRFWFYEIECSQMPRFWLRWAFEHLQLFHKVTDGTPADAQLATYLLEADVVVSADKNFLRITDAVRAYAQFSMAKTKLVAGDKIGATETLEFLRAGGGF
jgi:hypothetical protein